MRLLFDLYCDSAIEPPFPPPYIPRVWLIDGPLLVQYVSKRFEWIFADAGYLLAARGIGQMLMLLVLFPGISKLLSKCLRPAVKDLILGRASACLVILGSLLTGAPHI